jgi:FkbM family methyltransferase
MMLKSLAYRFVPKSLVAELRHWKHVRDLETATEPEEAMIKPLILPGQTVLDIGANFGVFTKLFSQLVGPQGSVISFEPVPQTYRTLAAGVERLRLGNVQTMNKAVSDSVGIATMAVPHYRDSSGENLYESHIVSPDSEGAFTVETITVDSLQLTNVSFIKIDVEGHEIEVLQGSMETLKRCHPTLMVEVSSSGTTDLLCGELGYTQPVVVSPSNQLFTYR